MSEFQADYIEPNVVEISHDGASVFWKFYVMLDGSGRRHLDGPHGSEEAMASGALMRRACEFAQADALHAGRIDY